MSALCEFCNREFKTTQGLRGHKTFVHGITKLSCRPVTRPATEQQRGELEDGSVGMEVMIVLNKPSQLKNRLDNTEEASNGQVSRPATQGTEYTEQLEEKTEQPEPCQVTKAKSNPGELGHMTQTDGPRKECVNACNNLLNIVNQNRDLVKRELSPVQEQTDATKQQVVDLLRIVELLGEQVRSLLALENKHQAQLDAISEKQARFENELGIVRNLALRQPTGGLVTHLLEDQRDHSFKEYRSSEGLTKPYRCSIDPILGDRWIDLAEPED